MSGLIVVLVVVGICFWLFGRPTDAQIRSPKLDQDDDESRSTLEATLRRAEAIYDSYAKFLEENPAVYYPQSALPFPKEEVKAALLQMLAYFRMQGNTSEEAVKAVENGYLSLSTFVPDEMARPHRTIMSALVQYKNSSQDHTAIREATRVINSTHEDRSIDAAFEWSLRERVRLKQEFDLRWSAMTSVGA